MASKHAYWSTTGKRSDPCQVCGQPWNHPNHFGMWEA